MSALTEHISTAAIPSVFEIGEITIAHEGGNWTCDALLINDVWAIHCYTKNAAGATVIDGVWTVTHRPSGTALMKYWNLSLALMAVGAMMAIPLPWAEATAAKELGKQYPNEIRQVRRALSEIDLLEDDPEDHL